MWLHEGVSPEKIKIQKNFPTFTEWIKRYTNKLKDGLVWETIEKIERVDTNDVRDMTVSRFHNFFANGFLVSNCQNFDISKVEPNIEHSIVMSPKELVEKTIEEGCQGTSMSFSEPTTFLEYALDVFKLAKRKGLYNTFITNGYFTAEALDLLMEAGCDAFNIDIKGCKEAVEKFCGADVEFVWQNAVEAKRKGAWVEITTLIIPTVNDDEKCLRSIAKRIYDEMGSDTPWHISRYYPAYKFVVPPTPVATLEKAFKIGKEEGLNFIYIGNVPGHAENTYCPSCGTLLIERFGFDILQFNLTKHNRCPKCGEKIPIVGKFIKRRKVWLF
ncbi:MAG TPA: radical SAM protein [Candidatus Aenigmarchaeota archaeon]|nr:radical SAM protein [Candidatus Aenigmarchaeota archaeon]